MLRFDGFEQSFEVSFTEAPAPCALNDLKEQRRPVLHGLREQLEQIGFDVLPSQANFILARPPGPPAEEWLELLRSKKILVRWFKQPAIRDFLRITIGTDGEAAALVKAARQILR